MKKSFKQFNFFPFQNANIINEYKFFKNVNVNNAIGYDLIPP